jgi:tRNA threonylcarbamoyladenosine biosynthesis protein TsaB
MTILCIETSTSVCSAAVCRDGLPAEQCICREGSNHARLLPCYVEQLLQFVRQHNWTLDAVALSEGPGSYTGLRIGTSTAKGLCYGLNVPLIPLPTLEVLCEAARKQAVNQHLEISNGILCPMIDARRMEVYTALYSSGRYAESTEQTRAVVVENEESVIAGNQETIADSQVYYFGDGAAKCQNVLTRPEWHYIPDIVPEAQYMGQLAEQAGRQKLTANQIAYYEPYYLKEFIAAQSHVKGLV